ncbi:MAG: DUF6492 family protein [Actinomycetota bacterium]|nr:DUF6492 family protein [Actinomycetota bacterium]
MLRYLLPARQPDVRDHQLTFVLPVTLKEGQRLGSGGWRSSPDDGAPLRLRFGIASLFAKFDLRDLCELLVLCPADELDDVAALVATVTDDPRVQIVPELDVCPDIVHAVDPLTGSIRGWYVQQMLKLAVAERVTTPFYVTLDSDVVCLQPFSSASLVTGGRGVCGFETIETYEALYTPGFAIREWENKERRMVTSAELLDYERDGRYRGRYPAETPVLFSTQAMRDMCAHLSGRHSRSWSMVLAESVGWTEMGLYFEYLEMAGRLEKLYEICGPNRVLHVEGSVWHASERYRHPRPYDAAHFERVIAEGGLFVAIQSWLALEAWLPGTGFESLPAFYAHLGEVLGVEM